MSRICIVSPSLKTGGIERALTVLAAQFVEEDFDVDFICCLRGPRFYTLPDSVGVHEPGFSRSSSFLNKILYYPRLIWFLRSKIKKICPDRVLVFGDWFSPITLLALLGTDYPVYISDRTIPDYKFKFPIPQLKRWLYPRSSGFIAQTNRARTFKERAFGNRLRIKCIPNAMPDLASDTVVSRENEILYVGRFAWEKDPEILVRAMPHVLRKYSDWKLRMVGSGPLLKEMETLAGRLNLSQHIIFMGNVVDVGTLYKRASLFVLPSSVEGFPNALIEAMSAGLPCVCFQDIPYEDIIVPHINGVVLKDRKPESLADALVTMIEDESLRHLVGKEAMKIRETLSPSRISGLILEFMCLK